MHCPMCNYALIGLPSAHNCPECGFSYDADTRIWCIRPSRLIVASLWLYIAILLIFVILVFSLATLNSGRPPLKLLIAGLSLTGIQAGFFAWLIRRGDRNQTLLGIGPAGIFTRNESSEFRITPWHDIRRIHASPDRLIRLNRAGIELTSGQIVRIAIPFAGKKFRDFVKAAQARMRIDEAGA